MKMTKVKTAAVAAAMVAQAQFVQAASEFDSLGYVAAVIGLLAFVFSYRLIYARNGLDAQIAKKGALLRKLQNDIIETEKRLKSLRESQANFQDRVGAEMKKADDAKRFTKADEAIKSEYWDRMGQLGSTVKEEESIKKLEAQKAEIEAMIELTKAKYLELDEKNFNNLMQEHQRQLIAVETRITRLKGEIHGD
jgi:chromosome segregation ATPase